MSSSPAGGNSFLMKEVSGEMPDWLELPGGPALRINDVSNLEADELQQHTSTSAFTAVSHYHAVLDSFPINAFPFQGYDV